MDERTPERERRVEISRDRLPVHCPLPEMSLWNAHPRVYLPLDERSEVRCPYCGTVYVLEEGAEAA